jgi:fatty-acyl-CoA synthase
MLIFRSGVALRKLSRFVSIRKNHFNAEFLGKNAANYAPLTPLSTFERAVSLYPSAAAYVYNDVHRTWGEVGHRVKSFASALVHIGVRRGDVVSIMCPNTPPIFEAHFAVPGAGAVLHTINTRLDAASIAFQLLHAETKVVLVDTEYNQVIQDVKRQLLLHDHHHRLPVFISIHDVNSLSLSSSDEGEDQTTTTTTIRATTTKATPSCLDTYQRESVVDTFSLEYESFLRSGDVHFPLLPCLDEWDAISLNYTSGTTGDPKGVVYHYRGAYLNAISNAIEWNMERFSRFLWVVPMFHCNGWVFPWTLAATVGCSYFVRYVRGDTLIEMIDQHRIGYLAGAPITMITMLGCKDSVKRRFQHPVKMWTAGAPPPPPVMKRFAEEFGVFVQTAYGLTETYGPCTSHLPDLEWKEKTAEELLLLSTIQARSAMVEGCKVIDVETMEEVPADGMS